MDKTWREIFKAPRMARLPSFIRDECFRRGLRLSIDVEKGWIRETVRVEVSGAPLMVDSLSRDLYAAMDAYNDRGAQSGAAPR